MKKLFKIFSQNKKTLVLVIGLGLFLSLVPLYSAQAVGFGDIFSAIGNVLGYLTSLPLRIVAFFIALGLFLVALVFGTVNFIIVAL